MVGLNPIRALVDRFLPRRRIIRRTQPVDINQRMALLRDIDDLRLEVARIEGPSP